MNVTGKLFNGRRFTTNAGLALFIAGFYLFIEYYETTN